MYTSFDETPLDKIITLLKSHKSEFVSGEKLSKSINLSRAAIWKNIKKLQLLGYQIESKAKVGYKFKSNTDLLLPWEISQGLQTDTIGRKIYYFETIDSTQNFALELSRKPHENGSVVVAQQQTNGRGRLNRKWISPKGGIWLSILLRPNFEIFQTSLFPMMTSLALAVAVEKKLNLNLELKWPNDLYLRGKKVAGILIDASIESNKIDYLVIGVGINFKISPNKLSKLIKNQKKYEVTTLIKENKGGDPICLVQQFLLELEGLYSKIISNPEVIREEWIKRSSTIGKSVTANTITEKLKGKAIGIDESGALILSSKGKIRHVLAGDITY